MKKIFDSQTTNGDSLEFTHEPGSTDNPGRSVLVISSDSVFDGATLTVKAKDPDGGFVPVRGGEIIEGNRHQIDDLRFTGIVTITDAGASTNITMWHGRYA